MKRRKFIQIAGGSGALIMIVPSVLSNNLGKTTTSLLKNKFLNPDLSDGPWVVWHWTSCNQTKEGVTSDLEGMAAAGITAANLFSFSPGRGYGGRGTVIENPAPPLTPEWFELINHTVNEAKRVGVTLSLQISAGWATAGGDWISPELSQQQIVWSQLDIEGGKTFDKQLPKPKRNGSENDPKEWLDYYRELAVLAFPIPEDWGETNITRNAKVTSNLPVTGISKLTDLSNKETTIRTKAEGWIQFEFSNPFTLRSIAMNPGQSGFRVNYNRPAHSLEIQASNDGVNYKKIGALEPMANSWQTRLSGLIHSVPETTAKYFRLVHHPSPPIGYDEHMQGDSFRGTGSGNWGQPMPGDKVEPNMLETINELAINSVQLSSTAHVHHYEGKTALVWGMSRRVTDEELPEASCIQMDSVVDLTDKLNGEGNIDNWQPRAGKWKIMRFGYTTMGRTNGSGIGEGLEADKFSAAGARISFNGWYKRVIDSIGPELSDSVVKMLNVDSWECGSQN